MSKIFISTNDEKVNDVIRVTTEAGIPLGKSVVKPNYSIASFKKINLDNENFFTCAQGSITGAGSFIYKEKIGCAALESILDDFLKFKDIKKVKESVIGNYFFVIEVEGKIYAFGDSNDIFDIFYYFESGHWTISNSLYDVSKSKVFSINKNALIETVFQNGIIDNETLFNDIYRLKGYQYIVVCLADKSFSVKKHKEIKVDVVTSEALVQSCHQLANSISKAYNDISVCMTGGLDSRLLLSSYLSSGCKPSLFYGVGNSALTNTKQEDLEVNKLIAEKFALKLNVMNWRVGDDFTNNWMSLANKIGFLSTIYSGIKSVHNELESISTSKFIDFGYFGEPFRNIEILDESSRIEYSAEQFVDELYINKELKRYFQTEDYNDYRLSLINKVKKLCKLKSVDESRITQDDFCQIHNEYRKSADTALINLANYYCYSINLLSLYQIETGAKSYKTCDKANSKLLLTMIQKLQPDILKLPIFSHCRSYTLDADKLELKLTVSNSFIGKTKTQLRKLQILKKFVRLVRMKSTKSDLDLKLKRQLLSMLEQDELTGAIAKDIFEVNDLRRLSKYVQIMNIIKFGRVKPK